MQRRRGEEKVEKVWRGVGLSLSAGMGERRRTGREVDGRGGTEGEVDEGGRREIRLRT